MSYLQYPQQQSPQQASQGGEPPLWAPLLRCAVSGSRQTVLQEVRHVLGRASRSEYWWWTLVSVGVSIVLNIIVSAGTAATTTSSLSTTVAPGPGAVFGTILIVIWALATIVPSMALSVRRLHDGNFNGWLLLLVLVPFAGALALLVFMLLPSNPAGQRFDQPAAA